jgi:hypothetical protein
LNQPASSPGGAGADAAPLEIVAVAHGPYPEVSRLNPEFITGIPRLKLTLRIDINGAPPQAEACLGALEAQFPSLARHRCCGDNSLRETFFSRGRRQSCSVQEADPGVDVAHLAEHLIIDIQHFVGRMKICSGVTCAYREPRNMFDIFVECPEEKVGRLGAAVASELVNDLLRGRPPRENSRCLMETARAARDNAGLPLSSFAAGLEMQWGSSAVAEAADDLRVQGFLTEREVTLNFSGVPIVSYAP